MEIKNRQIAQRFGYSHVPISHPKFEEQLEPKIKNSVIMLISLGYITTSSCQGHKNAPFITLDKKTTNENIVQHFNKFLVSCEIETDSIIIKGNRNLILSNSFLCKQIYKTVSKLPINTL
tara:strand:- start:52 stop:411 length:360 start_codon:yes stop_codon:yes gene_type:complete